MREIRLKARAKINISLDAVRKRPDGYHDLSMIMQTINLYDKISIKKSQSPDINIKTNLPFLPTDERNLIYKVVRYIKEEYKIDQGVNIDLFKVIPIAAGLAGGSADAAAAIKGMNHIFHLKLSIEEMIAIGKRFGADIPFCLVEGTVLAEGIGDKMTKLNSFPDCHIVIVKPNISISTASIFSKLKADEIIERPNTPVLIEAIEKGDIKLICKSLRNVLEDVTIKEYPYIQDVKQILVMNGAMGALMSGSGSAVFGIFGNKNTAVKAAEILKKQDMIRFAYVTTIYNRRRSR